MATLGHTVKAFDDDLGDMSALETQLSRVCDAAWVDRGAFEQVLANLLENAVKYAGEGASVSVRAHLDDDRAVVSVSDTGTGIAPQHLERLFERFYRVDAGRSREVGGTGLGLAIVKHLARQHGGEVSVESELGTGTRFTIDLPQEL